MTRMLLDLDIQDVKRPSGARCPLLQSLDLSGCHGVTDFGFMQLFSVVFGIAKDCRISPSLQNLNVSGCKRLTDHSLRLVLC